ncbi:MAG: hypothetical protein Q4D14_07550, partial [Bacteroidales bacterium]|nr:hypothetical protein [Bacteroidales bacterium]
KLPTRNYFQHENFRASPQQTVVGCNETKSVEAEQSTKDKSPPYIITKTLTFATNISTEYFSSLQTKQRTTH